MQSEASTRFPTGILQEESEKLANSSKQELVQLSMGEGGGDSQRREPEPNNRVGYSWVLSRGHGSEVGGLRHWAELVHAPLKVDSPAGGLAHSRCSWSLWNTRREGAWTLFREQWGIRGVSHPLVPMPQTAITCSVGCTPRSSHPASL